VGGFFRIFGTFSNECLLYLRLRNFKVIFFRVFEDGGG